MDKKKKEELYKVTGKSLVDLDTTLTMLHNRYDMDNLEIEVANLRGNNIGWVVKAKISN